MNYLALNNNHQMPSLGLGTWRSDSEDDFEAIVKAILELNYRHVDCASIYGNEKIIGKAFNKVFSSNQVSREDVFITSKLWNTNHHPNNVEAACRQTLKDLQLDYLDLYLIHWGLAFVHGESSVPMGENGLVKIEPVSIQDTWLAMEKLVEKGLVKSIGVANFTCPMIIDLLSYAKIKPAINQIEVHPYNTQEELIDFCHKKNIQITAYSPLGSSSVNSNRPIEDKTVIEIAHNHGKTPAQVLIRWVLQKKLSVIPKSTKLHRIAENIDVFGFELSEDEMTVLNNLNKNFRFVNPVEWGVPYFK